MAPRHPLYATLRWFRACMVTGVLGLAVLLAAVGVAAANYSACGPSRLAAEAAACRAGVQLLIGAYALLALALVLGAVSLSLVWRVRRRIRQRATG